MKKITGCLLLIFAIVACQKEKTINYSIADPKEETPLKKPTPPPPSSANPAIAFKENFQQGNRTIPAIYVMDANGNNKTKLYTNYTSQVVNFPDYPAWSSDATQLCFTMNNADIYRLDITLVNGQPIASNATKIGDGLAGGGTYKQGKWRPGQNQIACVWKKNGDADKIHLMTSSGGSPAVLYSASSTDWVIEDDIAFRSDGTELLFSERQISTGLVFLKVMDVNSSQVIKSINLSQFKSIRELDWAKSPGSSIVAITTVPLCNNSTPVNLNGIHQLQTLDVAASLPSLTLHRNDVGNIAWSTDDTRIAVSAGLGRAFGPQCAFSQYFSLATYTLATQTFSFFSNNSNSNHPDWKR